MLALGVTLIVLALLAWGARAILTGLQAPAWLLQVVVVVVLIIAVVIIANAFGVATPNLR